MKTLFISGSPRSGNTEFILNKIYKVTEGSKEFVLLRKLDIKHCVGCLHCEEHKKCAIHDDMQKLYGKIEKADLIVIGTPNYFDNVPGIMKDFIDRTNPLYDTERLEGKKLIMIVTGGGKIKNSKRVTDQALKYFSNGYKLKTVGKYYFQALHKDEIRKNVKALSSIDAISKKINSI
jgi:multimeric flavodoxin WrbA